MSLSLSQGTKNGFEYICRSVTESGKRGIGVILNMMMVTHCQKIRKK